MTESEVSDVEFEVVEEKPMTPAQESSTVVQVVKHHSELTTVPDALTVPKVDPTLALSPAEVESLPPAVQVQYTRDRVDHLLDLRSKAYEERAVKAQLKMKVGKRVLRLAFDIRDQDDPALLK